MNEAYDSFSIVLTHPPNLHVAVNNRSFVFRFNFYNSTILTSEINMERGGRKEIGIGVSTNLTSIVGYQELNDIRSGFLCHENSLVPSHSFHVSTEEKLKSRG